MSGLFGQYPNPFDGTCTTLQAFHCTVGGICLDTNCTAIDDYIAKHFSRQPFIVNNADVFVVAVDGNFPRSKTLDWRFVVYLDVVPAVVEVAKFVHTPQFNHQCTSITTEERNSIHQWCHDHARPIASRWWILREVFTNGKVFFDLGNSVAIEVDVIVIVSFAVSV